MSQPSEKIPLTMIVGPTAVGKTAFAIGLAKLVNAEIVSADSRYLYRGMDIGTAKPSQAEMDGVPHHLINVAEPDEIWNLALFQQQADEAIRDIYSRGKNVIVCGGTGQYIRAISEGWSVPEQEPDPHMRVVLEKWAEEIGAAELHNKLALIDPEAADVIQYQNVRRTIRALEVILCTGYKFSEQRTKGEPPYRIHTIGLYRDRSELYSRIDKRIDMMINSGLIEETRALLEMGYDRKLPALSAIGYREICSYLSGEYSLDQAVVLMKRNTRTFVRRQANWFKLSDHDILWYNLTGKD